MSSAAHTQLLSSIEQYIDLTAEEKEQFFAKVSTANYKKGEFLLKASQLCNRQFFIVKGCVRTFYIDQRAEEHIIQFGIENWWAADLNSFINITPADYHIQALEDCEVCIITHEQIEQLYQQIPAFERFFRIIIQKAYAAAQQRIIAVISKTAEERYADFLKRYKGLDQRVPQYMIASYIGVTPEFFSKMKKEFYR